MDLRAETTLCLKESAFLPGCTRGGDLMPKRIQIRRNRPWQTTPKAIKVDRSTPWGNPYRKGEHGTAEHCVRLYIASHTDDAAFRARIWPGRISPAGVNQTTGAMRTCCCGGPMSGHCAANTIEEGHNFYNTFTRS